MMAHEIGELALHAPINIRLGRLAGDPEVHRALKPAIGRLIGDEPTDPDAKTVTTLGRASSSTRRSPTGTSRTSTVVIKSDIRLLIETIIERYPRSAVAKTLDNIKDLGFRYATKAGLTIALDDVRTPADKAAILAEYEERAEKVQSLFAKGVVTDDERRQELIEIWTEATERVTESMKKSLKEQRFNSLDMMVGSGARGNMMQLRQIAGMRGLVANPKGDIIPRPIIANFREGLSVLEYFISTHGARKGLADTALRTADSGYLTRRLVDVSQEMIVLEEDCETDRGIPVKVVDDRGNKIRNLRSRIYGRALADDVKEERTLVTTENGEKLGPGPSSGPRAPCHRRCRHHVGPREVAPHLRHPGRRLPEVLRPVTGDRQDRGDR
jgi:DNA-directed RNA polymerase subunit beta'